MTIAAGKSFGNGLLRHIMDCARDAVLVVAPDEMVLLDVNKTASQMIGCTREDLIGLDLSSVECSLLDLFFWEDLKQMPLFDGCRVVESEWLTRDGRSLPIEKRVTSYSEDGKIYWVIHVEDITRRHQIIEEQVRLASQLQSSLDATAEGILSVDLYGKVININHRFTSILNVPDELLVARNTSQIMDYLKSCLIDASTFTASLLSLQLEPEMETEDTLALSDGRYFICVSKPEFLQDRLLGRVFSIRDITALKRVEIDLIAARDLAEEASVEKSRTLDALRVSESHLRRLVNSSLIGIFQGDMTGRLSEANDVLLKLAGIERGDLSSANLNWFEMVSPAHLCAHQEALAELQLHGHAAPFEAELISKEGVQVPVMVGLLRLEGSKHDLVGFVMDLTEQRRADRIKSEFISVVSHELRTPLTAIRGALGLLEGGVVGDLSPGIMQLIKIAHKNSQRLGALVNDILDMEKLMSGNMTINMERIDVVLLAKQAIEANAAYAGTLGVHYQLGAHPDQGWAMGDAARVMQVFANLLSNAAKYAPTGDYVEIRVLEAEGAFRVEVQDRGPGIPLAFRQRIFSKFAQADGSDTRQQGGTGLGLNITKTLVEKMGGKIGFDSEEGLGSTFWFTLLAEYGHQS